MTTTATTHDKLAQPYFSVFVNGELIKYEVEPNGFMKTYPYSVALELAKPYQNAEIRVTAYSRKLV